jgi:hypothetical protein
LNCAHCGKVFEPDPRVRNQKYCGAKRCQSARRVKWNRAKMKSDKDYKENQQLCQKQWQQKNPGYYMEFRRTHPEYTQRNRQLQLWRNKKMRERGKCALIANSDALGLGFSPREKQLFRLIPHKKNAIANSDALIFIRVDAVEAGAGAYSGELQKMTR